MTRRLVVIGAGGFGREVLELIEDINQEGNTEPMELVGVLDDAAPDEELLGRLGAVHLGPLGVLRNMPPDVTHVIAIGSCAAKRRVDESCRLWGRRAETLVHPTATIGRRSVEMGEGAIVCAHTTVTTNVRTGRHVHLNPGVTIGHDSVVGDHSTLTPQVAIAGHVRIDAEVFVGTGAVVRPGVHIAEGSLVGAGAVVVRNVLPGQTVVGVPASDFIR